MALITCPECGQKISEHAQFCPHCGCPQKLFENNSELSYFDYEATSNNTCKITKYTGQSKDVKIPSKIGPYTVNAIHEKTFKGYENIITSIVLPDSLTEIEPRVFNYFHALKSVVFPKNLQYIGARAFSSCDNLTEINLPEGLNSIDLYCFESCNSLKSVKLPESLCSIGDGAFGGCKNLKFIFIGKNLSTITSNCGNKHFLMHCKSLETIKVDPSNHFFDSRNDCNALIETATNTILAGCKSTKIPTTIKIIGDSAFNGSSIKNVNMPDNVELIGEYAFANCAELEQCILSRKIKCIPRNAFIYSSLKKIIIPGDLNEIGKDAFYGCENALPTYIRDKFHI